MNFDCNGINYKIQHLNLCRFCCNVVCTLHTLCAPHLFRLYLYHWIYELNMKTKENKTAPNMSRNSLEQTLCHWCSKYITRTCVYPLISITRTYTYRTACILQMFLAVVFFLSFASIQFSFSISVRFDWAGEIYWHSVSFRSTIIYD